MKIDFKNSIKMNFFFLETQIWYAWLNVGSNWVLIRQEKKHKFYLYITYKSFKGSNKQFINELNLIVHYTMKLGSSTLLSSQCLLYK